MRRLLISLLLISCMFAGNASVQVSAPTSFVLGASGGNIPITLKVLGPDGSPAKGMGVIIRIVDLNSSGILGASNHSDISRLTDSNGMVSGTIDLPPLNSSGVSREGFPLTLRVQGYAFRHDWTAEWAAQGSADVLVQSAAPLVSSISVPSEINSGANTTIQFTLTDVDSPNAVATAKLPGNMSASSSITKTYPFGGNDQLVSINWLVPRRGLNKNEVMMAMQLGGSIEPATISLVSPSSTRLSTCVAGFVPVVPYSTIIFQEDAPANPQSAYSMAGISLSKADYNFGFLLFEADGPVAQTALTSSNSGLANALSGSIGKRLASIPQNYSTQFYPLSVNATDGALAYSYMYPLKTSYAGFLGLGS
jgi:hypothetical protein